MSRMDLIKTLVEDAVKMAMVSNGLRNDMPSSVVTATGEVREALQEDAIYNHFEIPHLLIKCHEQNQDDQLPVFIENTVKTIIGNTLLEFKPKAIVAAMGGKLFGVELRVGEYNGVKGFIYSYPVYAK